MLTVSSSKANFVPVVCDSKSGEKKGIFAAIKKVGSYCKDKFSHSEITKGKTTVLKIIGDFFTGAGLIAASCGAGSLSLMPIFAGIGMNVTGVFASLDKK